MDTTQVVVPTLIGGLLAISGTWIGAFWQARSAARLQLAKEERDDGLLLHRDRLAAYSSFYLAMGQMRRTLRPYPGRAAQDDPDIQRAARAARNELWTRYSLVVLIAPESVLTMASKILDYVDGIVFGDRPWDDPLWEELLADWISAARRALIPTHSP